MADREVNTENSGSSNMITNSPENSVTEIFEEADVIMVTAEEGATTSVCISDEECMEKATNLEEINISDDDNDMNDINCIESEIEAENQNFTNENTMPCKNASKQIAVCFSSHEVLMEFKEQFETFLRSFTQFDYEEQHTKLILSYGTELESLSEINNIDSSIQRVENLKNKNNSHCTNVTESIFVLDTEPSTEVTNRPIYRSKYKVIDDIAVESDNDSQTNKEETKVSCFNCDGAHTLRDCPHPKDMRKIRLAKQKMYTKLVRYHEDADNKYKNFKAGILSERLKKALGIRRYDIPPHIYKMRIMGYPPGWLEEAKVFHSNLALFDSDGKQDASSHIVTSYTIAPEKIIDYPGYNCQPGRGCRDEYNYHGVPPYSTALSKENMIECVNRLLQQEAEIKRTQQVHTDLKSKSPSPTLNDLEIQKRQLLEQLTNNDCSNTSIPTIDLIGTLEEDPHGNDIVEIVDNADENGPPCEKLSSPIVDLDATGSNLDQLLEENDDNLASAAPVTHSTPSTSAACSSNVCGSLPGTPLIKSLSPYARLPCLDNFQKDVSPVINFENLPNATGKYEQMTTVLEKVRTTLKQKFHS